MSPFAPILAALAALALTFVRWWLQGSGNMWTDADRRLYVKDPDLGWRLSDKGGPWLGLDAVILVAGIALAVAAACWWIRRRERKIGPQKTLRKITWVAAVVPIALPMWAIVTTQYPKGARETLPEGVASPPPAGVSGGLAGAPAGRYVVKPHAGTTLVASVKAGGERFEARFGGIAGSLVGDPSDLEQPLSARITARTDTVDTGVDMRSKHAREDYLLAAKHPEIAFTITRLVGARAHGPEVDFSAEGIVSLIGRDHPVSVSGVLKRPDEAARKRLAVEGDVLLVNARFTIDVNATPLSADAGDFDSPAIDVTAGLVLVREVIR